MRPIRRHMAGAGPRGRGLQGRVQPRPARGQLPLPRRAADGRRPRRSTRTPPRRSPTQHGAALTFIAKYDEREGNSCHIHCSFWDGDGACSRRRTGTRSRRSTSLHRRPDRAHAPSWPPLRAERQLVQALRARLVRADRRWPGATTTAPARSAPSGTARACGWRAAWPGGDVNPYLAFAATIAAGLDGIDRGLELGPGVRGNAYDADAAARAVAACTRRSAAWRARRSRARRSATRSSTTT